MPYIEQLQKSQKCLCTLGNKNITLPAKELIQIHLL